MKLVGLEQTEKHRVWGKVQTLHLPSKIVNEGYQNLRRAESYDATQKYVVDKTVFFKKIVELIRKESKMRILELGMGTGSLLDHMMSAGIMRDIVGFEYVGLDISKEMVDIAETKAKKQKAAGTLADWSHLSMISGVNLLDPRDQVVRKLFEAAKFDIIVSSQFEHYLPNSHSSRLGRALPSFYFTKKEFRLFVSKLLTKTGLYLTIDDGLAEDGNGSKSQVEINREWDEKVALNLTSPIVLSEIEKGSPELATKIRNMYPPDLEHDELIKRVKVERLLRREKCKEEIEKFSQTKEDFGLLFGHIVYLQHPELPNFYMMFGYNNGEYKSRRQGA